jgi:hypothetical protein
MIFKFAVEIQTPVILLLKAKRVAFRRVVQSIVITIITLNYQTFSHQKTNGKIATMGVEKKVVLSYILLTHKILIKQSAFTAIQ